jgi:flagellar biogenesis protein FliO
MALFLVLVLILIFILHLNRFLHSSLPSLSISMSTSLADPKLQDYGEEAGAGA